MALRNQNTDINNFIRNATNTQGFASAFGLEVPETLVPVLITNPTAFPIIVSSTAAPSLPAPATGQSIVQQTSNTGAITYVQNVPTQQLTYTVTTGKTLYITDFWSATYVNFRTTFATLVINGVYMATLQVPNGVSGSGNLGFNGKYSFNTPLVATSGQVVQIMITTLEGSAALTINSGFCGMEQ